jgi:hypothetical protein
MLKKPTGFRLPSFYGPSGRPGPIWEIFTLDTPTRVHFGGPYKTQRKMERSLTMGVPDIIKTIKEHLAKQDPLNLQGDLYQHQETGDYWILYRKAEGGWRWCCFNENSDIERLELREGVDDYVLENLDELEYVLVDS